MLGRVMGAVVELRAVASVRLFRALRKPSVGCVCEAERAGWASVVVEMITARAATTAQRQKCEPARSRSQLTTVSGSAAIVVAAWMGVLPLLV